MAAAMLLIPRSAGVLANHRSFYCHGCATTLRVTKATFDPEGSPIPFSGCDSIDVPCEVCHRKYDYKPAEAVLVYWPG
jgi:hypothetical protein